LNFFAFYPKNHHNSQKIKKYHWKKDQKYRNSTKFLHKTKISLIKFDNLFFYDSFVLMKDSIWALSFALNYNIIVTAILWGLNHQRWVGMAQKTEYFQSTSIHLIISLSAQVLINKSFFNNKDKALKDASRYGKSLTTDYHFILIKKIFEFFMDYTKQIKTLMLFVILPMVLI